MKPPLGLAATDWLVQSVPDHGTASRFILNHHYSHSTSNTSVYRHGLYFDDPSTSPLVGELMGVALWLPPTRGLHIGRVRQMNRRWSEVLVPKIGWVRFRRSRPVPDAKSYRVIHRPSGRWYVAFAVIPDPVVGPGNSSVIGIDRGVAVTLTLSDGTTYRAPHDRSVKRLQRQLARAEKDSNRRGRVKTRLARAYAKNADCRKDWAEKTSTVIARRYDLIRVENLRIERMTRSAKGTIENPGRNVRAKAGLNRVILAQGWGLFARRLQEKARGRVEKINPAYTSQTCSACGHVDANSRESQAKFVCTACGYVDNADVNAAKNIAAGHAVTARRGLGVVDLPSKREPQLVS